MELMPWQVTRVSIHVPARGTTIPVNMAGTQYMFQSTFPQGERRGYQPIEYMLSGVSIHVPARGTTEFGKQTNHLADVSIHVPARGTTGHRHRHRSGRTRFNPRSRKGNDLRVSQQAVSDGCFNPRSRKGNDATCLVIIAFSWVSIHVPARGTTC